MKFKAPRDPNTKSIMLKIRDIPPGEYWPCHVGSGECQEPAIEAMDDARGGEFLVCAKHLPEVEALGKLMAEMTQGDISRFTAAIDRAENSP